MFDRRGCDMAAATATATAALEAMGVQSARMGNGGTFVGYEHGGGLVP